MKNKSVFECFRDCSFNQVLMIGSPHQIIQTNLIVIGNANQHFNGDVSGARLIMRIGALADVKNLTHFFLGKIRIYP